MEMTCDTMATIKIFSASGIKELNCFDTADDVDYIVEEESLVDDGELDIELPE